MPNEYARAVHELVQAKIEQRAPEVEIETAKRETPEVVNIMDALEKSRQAKAENESQRRGSEANGQGSPEPRGGTDIQFELAAPHVGLRITVSGPPVAPKTKAAEPTEGSSRR